MIFIYDNNGKVTNLLLDNESQFVDLMNINYLKVDETASNIQTLKQLREMAAIKSISDSFQYDAEIIDNILYVNSQPVIFEIDADKANIRDIYQDAITRLLQIETTAPSGTQAQQIAQIVSAIQDMAYYQRLALIYLRKQIEE